MSANKTQQTQMNVQAFIDGVDHEHKRDEARQLDALFRRVTGEEPAMWGPSMIGYGRYLSLIHI